MHCRFQRKHEIMKLYLKSIYRGLKSSIDAFCLLFYKGSTYCPFLWDEINISVDGEVFSCCHDKPAVLGNIKNNQLSEILNGVQLKNFRRKSIQGKLACMMSCSLVKKNLPVPVNLSIESSIHPKRLKILFSKACNIRCLMCRQNHTDGISLPFDTLLASSDLLSFQHIEIQGGEPLFHKDAKNLFKYAADNNIKVSFLTNGTLITEEWAENIALNSDYINFSLNAATAKTHEVINKGSNWDKVLKNIQLVRQAREELHTSLKIIGHFTVIPRNIEEIPLFIQKFETLGLDYIEFGIDKCIPIFLLAHPYKRLALKKHIHRVLSETKLDKDSIEGLHYFC